MFDLSGTLISIKVFRDHNQAVKRAFARMVGIDYESPFLLQALVDGRTSGKPAEMLSQPFYLYRDLFRERYIRSAELLGCTLSQVDGDQLSLMWWQNCLSHYKDLRGVGLGLRVFAVETLNEFHARGLQLGIVSNFDQEFLDRFLVDDPILRLFSFVVTSEACYSCKPDNRIFQIALDRYGGQAETVMFVGDTPSQDIKGAVQAGMISVHIRPESDKKNVEMTPLYTADYQIDELSDLIPILNKHTLPLRDS